MADAPSEDWSCGYCGPGDPDPMCDVHFPAPAWLPGWARRCAIVWRRAKADPERGELTNGDHNGIVHGWWVTPTSWGLGLTVDTDLDDHPGLFIQAGPFSWVIAREYRLP